MIILLETYFLCLQRRGCLVQFSLLCCNNFEVIVGHNGLFHFDPHRYNHK